MTTGYDREAYQRTRRDLAKVERRNAQIRAARAARRAQGRLCPSDAARSRRYQKQKEDAAKAFVGSGSAGVSAENFVPPANAFPVRPIVFDEDRPVRTLWQRMQALHDKMDAVLAETRDVVRMPFEPKQRAR
jgi:hypothetical protein